MSMQIDGPKGSPLMFIYSQRKIFENLSTSYLCKKYTKLKMIFLGINDGFAYLLDRKEKNEDNFD